MSDMTATVILTALRNYYPILQMRKPRLRAVKLLAQSHIAREVGE